MIMMVIGHDHHDNNDHDDDDDDASDGNIKQCLWTILHRLMR